MQFRCISAHSHYYSAHLKSWIRIAKCFATVSSAVSAAVAPVSTPCWLAANDAGSGFKNYIKLPQHRAHTVGGHSEPWAQCSKCSQGRSTSNIAANFSLAFSLSVSISSIACSLALLPVHINLNGRPQLKHAQRVRGSSYGKVRGQSWIKVVASKAKNKKRIIK